MDPDAGFMVGLGAGGRVRGAERHRVDAFTLNSRRPPGVWTPRAFVRLSKPPKCWGLFSLLAQRCVDGDAQPFWVGEGFADDARCERVAGRHTNHRDR